MYCRFTNLQVLYLFKKYAQFLALIQVALVGCKQETPRQLA